MPKKVLAIYPTYAVEYTSFAEWERTPVNWKKPPERISTGTMSKESRKKLMNGIQWMKLFSPLHKTYCNQEKRWFTFKMNFITLTLSQSQYHDDAYIKQHMLEPFLKWMIRKGANTYVWKAETQNNGNIHFHITTNYYLHWRAIRNKWNALQQNHGYLKDFISEHGHGDPNSTDIHAVKKDNEIGGYLGKYFGKLELWCQDQTNKLNKNIVTHPSRLLDECTKTDKPMPVPKRQINGRKWSLSNNLVNLKCFLHEDEPNYLQNVTEFITAQDFESINTDFASLWFYPHLLEGKAPQHVIDKLARLAKQVQNHRDQ